jgi:hypothetical protein
MKQKVLSDRGMNSISFPYDIFALDHSCESLRFDSAFSSSLPGFVIC